MPGPSGVFKATLRFTKNGARFLTGGHGMSCWKRGGVWNRIPAAQFLADRLMDTPRPVRELAPGPLTNIAAAKAIGPRTGSAVSELIWMGAAVGVVGNVDAVKAAEWNSFVDAEAVERVLLLGWKTPIVPLGAANRAPVTAATLRMFEEAARECAAPIRTGRYSAWDWLAAMAAVHATQPMARTAPPRAARDNPVESGSFSSLMAFALLNLYSMQCIPFENRIPIARSFLCASLRLELGRRGRSWLCDRPAGSNHPPDEANVNLRQTRVSSTRRDTSASVELRK